MKNKIPEFKNYKDEAEFWDTHDVTDYLKEMKLEDVEFLPRQVKTESVTIRIEPELKKRLEEIARMNSVSLSTLARLSLIDKLRTKHSI